MSPSSLTYWTPSSLARRSSGSSFSLSDSDWFSGWRYSALPSSETFESSARTSRSGVTIRGLISASVASSDSHTSYSATSASATPSTTSASAPPSRAICSACSRESPSSGSTWARISFSGVLSATSSMSTPPSTLNITSGFLAERSSSTEA